MAVGVASILLRLPFMLGASFVMSFGKKIRCSTGATKPDHRY
jgi:hypothetical protein